MNVEGHRKAFIKCLQEAAPNHHLFEVFGLWAECAACSFRQSVRVYRTGSEDPDIEERYMSNIAKIKTSGKFSEALAHVVMGLEIQQHDFLGTAAAECELLNAGAGQFFTPTALSDLMARVTLNDIKPDPQKRILIQEPAVGGGATVIATANVLKDQGFYPWNYYVVCQDVDFRMFCVSYIQLTLCGIPANVLHGNTLTLETWDSEETMAAVLHPYREPEKTTPMILDRRPVDIVRWMGAEGLKWTQAKAILKEHGFKSTRKQIEHRMSEGCAGNFVELDDTEVDELYTMLLNCGALT